MNGIKPSNTNRNPYQGKLANLRSIRFYNLHLNVSDNVENNSNNAQTFTGPSEQQQLPSTRISNRRRSTINSIGVNPLQEIEDSISSQKLLQLN